MPDFAMLAEHSPSFTWEAKNVAKRGVFITGTTMGNFARARRAANMHRRHLRAIDAMVV